MAGYATGIGAAEDNDSGYGGVAGMNSHLYACVKWKLRQHDSDVFSITL